MQTRKKTTPPPAPAKAANAGNIPWKTIYIVCAALAFMLYANTLGHDYTVDDTTVIKNNKFTTQGFAGIDDIFKGSYRAGFWDRKEGLYRPLSVVMFAIEWQLAPDNPFPGHLINVFMYALTAVVLLSVMRRLMKSLHPIIPLAATLLWIFHPLHTEVVANIKSRDELLSFLFGLLTLRSFFLYYDNKKSLQLVLSLFYFFIALLSKENSITWAAVVPLAAWCCTDSSPGKSLKLSLPYFGLVAVYFGIRQAILGEVGGGYELMLINNSILGANGMGERLGTAFYILGKYLLLFLLPVTLVFDYSYNTIPVVSVANPMALLSLALYLGAFVYAIRGLSSRSAVSFGLLFFFGTFALVSNVFFLIEATMAERFLFTPSMGLCMAATALLFGKPARSLKDSGGITAKDIRSSRIAVPLAVVLVLFAGRTISRNADWKDNFILLQKDVKSSPQSARIRYALGSTFLVEKALEEPEGSVQRSNYLDQAIRELTTGVSILPNYNDAWYHLGIAYKEKGDGPNAVASFEKARSYKPFTEASRLVSSGVAYGMVKDYQKAIADLKEAISLDPKDADAWNNYGLYLSEAGQTEASLEALDKAIALRKNFDKAMYNKGNAWAKAGNYRNALAEYARALEIKPGYTDALNNSGNCYVMMQRPDSAIIYFERAVQADPNNLNAVINLGMSYRNTGDTATANRYFQKARSMGAGI